MVENAAAAETSSALVDVILRGIATIVEAVKQPLGLAALIVIAGAGLVGYLLYRSPPQRKETARLVQLLLVGLGVLAVAALAAQVYLQGGHGPGRTPLTAIEAEDLVGNARERILRCLGPLACKKIRFEFPRASPAKLQRITAELDGPSAASWTADATAAACVRDVLYGQLGRFDATADVFAEYACAKTGPKPVPAAQAPCAVDAEFATAWNVARPRCKDFRSDPAKESEAAAYRTVRGWERCESFVVYRCR